MNQSDETSGTAPGPLQGIKVLDLTSVVLGPLATQILGDYGADVIKVEGIDGDLMRANGVSRNPGMSSIFLAINRNKRSISLDLKQASGRKIFMDLAARTDVLIHNMRVPAIERLGLGYQAVRAVRPDIVYCAATGFGQNGPHHAKPAFDDIVQAACGMAGLLGKAGGKPDYVPSLIADKTAGMAVVNAVLAALFHRQRCGQGQYIEVPMLETLVEFTMAEHMGGLAFDPPRGKAGYGRIVSGGRRPEKTADGFIAMLPYSPAQWNALFERVGRADLLRPYKLSTRQQLNDSIRDLYRELGVITPTRSTAEWMAVCEELDVPATPIYELDDLPEHPHLKAVGMFQAADHPTEGAIRMVRPATMFAQTPARIHRLAPVLGQHSEEILAELGYDPAECEDFRRNNVVGAARNAQAATSPAVNVQVL
ncbi:MAG: CoA transferase [Burkholderiaceae bacterium]|nr:CoA transferase [Burkholderiaceae bacterium]